MCSLSDNNMVINLMLQIYNINIAIKKNKTLLIKFNT